MENNYLANEIEAPILVIFFNRKDTFASPSLPAL